VDTGTKSRETAPLQSFCASPNAATAGGGRSVDVENAQRRLDRGQTG
jgi:hypothetical protein